MTASLVPAPALEWPLPARSARVRLRRLHSGDLEAFQSYRSDPEVGRYQGWQPMSESVALDFIRSMDGVRGPVPGQWIQLGIAEVDRDTLIGDIGLYVSDEGTQAEIGFSCSRAYQGRGLASEAVNLVLRLLFQHSACASVRAVVDARNIRSIRLLERMGLEWVGESETVFRGEPCTEITYVVQSPWTRGGRHQSDMPPAPPA